MDRFFMQYDLLIKMFSFGVVIEYGDYDSFVDYVEHILVMNLTISRVILLT